MKIFRIAKQQYYHGSYDDLPVNTVLTPENGNFMGTFEEYEMDSHFKLEQFRPSSYLSRDNAIYMCDNPDDIDNAGGASDHIYLVVPLGKVEKHDLNWMSEIDLIMSEAAENGETESEATIQKVMDAALNYWNGVPHYNESVWEYLAPSAQILQEYMD